MKKDKTAIYIPNMDTDTFEKICQEKGLQFVYVEVPEHLQTNADRIRAMSDEDLAVWFCTDRECDTQHCEFCKMDGCHIEDWLKSPVE